MRKCTGILLLLLATGCDRQVAKLSETELQTIRAHAPGLKQECVETLRLEGFAGKSDLSTERCFPLTEPRRWAGLWRDDFEGSQFCPAPARHCTFDSQTERIWLDPRDQSSTVVKHPGNGALYAVEFIGRRTTYPGMYGHLGMSQHEIIVDRMLSIKMIEPGEPPLTEAEEKAWFEKCRKAGDCGTFEELTGMKQDETACTNAVE